MEEITKQKRTSSDNSDQQIKKSKKQYHKAGSKAEKKGKHGFRAPTFGSVGVLCTCEKRFQKMCGREARILLEETFHRKYVPEEEQEKEEEDGNQQASIADLLSAEIADEIQSTQNSNTQGRLWEFTDTKCAGLEYLELNPYNAQQMKNETVVDLVNALFQNRKASLLSGQTGHTSSRHIRRMIPLLFVTHADDQSLQTGINEICSPSVQNCVSEGKPYKYRIEFKRRNSSNLDFDETVSSVGTTLKHLIESISPDPDRKTEACLRWKDADYIIHVEVFTNVLGLSIVSTEDWEASSRWSFDYVAKEEAPEQSKSSEKAPSSQGLSEKPTESEEKPEESVV
ncbi:putative tRNA acetyltransferase TAN1 [Blattamonas nauphoetae]|uniref:tRNA acetyltransferase TAN1 n=1 Tax=Blattamonas nauphoetae TaxID=2049346 RepID=A0ABQ9Y0A6_9EUKA|nr:putative tRNA acetyltransferase TAN1 [Blattamonas nauphoetae]